MSANPFIKLIKTDCYDYALQNKGVINKAVLEDICLNPAYKPIFDIYFGEREGAKFSLSYILSHCDFLEELKPATIKSLKLKAKKGEYLCHPAYVECEKKALLDPFYQFGLDPHTFLKELYKNLNKRALSTGVKNSYLFNLDHLLEGSPLSHIEDEEFFNEEHNQSATDDWEENNSDIETPSDDGFTVKRKGRGSLKAKNAVKKLKNETEEKTNLNEAPDDMWISGNTENLLKKNVIKNALQILDKKQQKECFDYFRERTLAEQNLINVDSRDKLAVERQKLAIQEQGEFIHRAIREHGLLNIIKVLEEIRRRPTQPSNIRSAFIYKLMDLKTEDGSNYEYQ